MAAGVQGHDARPHARHARPHRVVAGGKLELFGRDGNPAQPPPTTAAWYRLNITVGGRDMKPFTFTRVYVPSFNRVRVRAEGGGFVWQEAQQDLAPVLFNVSAGLDPLPASQLTGLDAVLPAPKVSEVVPPRSGGGTGGGGTPWAWIGLGALAAGGVLLALARWLRGRPVPATR